MTKIKLDSRELAHVLAGLRALQTLRYSKHLKLIEGYLITGEGHEPMTDQEIDDLCERINR
jgi:hypothetical protein